MWRSFSEDFINEHWWVYTDEGLRFRSPPGATNIQCRLWKESGNWYREKWQSYPVIEIVKTTTETILQCPGIWNNGECPSGWWCAQLWYNDLKVNKV